ncbi:MAG TPA: DUF4910 domain-containing protein [Thermoanaerobaculia bacterium]|jgi:hypothetical protein|nr:DUF4910 domain-containing protein [Thermoanaerobaculia bacterium]
MPQSRLSAALRSTIGFAILLALAAPSFAARPDEAPLLPQATVAALAEEISGEAAKRDLDFLSRQHRMRGSRGFRAAAEFVANALREDGLAGVEIVEIPADGKTFYGTQRSRRPWDAEFAELWELEKSGDAWVPRHRLASWDTLPLSLAQDSESADVTAELIDVGAGTKPEDYAGRDVRGKIVLVSSQPEAVVPLAIGRFDAAGIVSYAQNQRTAWWGENENLVRWGHAGSFNAKPTFAFMVSLKTARGLQERLRAGEAIRLHATVRAGQHDGHYDVVTGTIPGADAARANEEIVFSCHLDHPHPGANDNASGCATILEIARTFSKLIRDGKLERPARTIRFLFPPEVEGTLSLLVLRPELAARIKAAIHLDMVGGGPETKAIFHVTRGPASLPSFVHDVAAAFGELVNRQSAAFASGEAATYPLVAPEGGKEALQADFADLTLGSDHEVYSEGSFGIPAIYLNDWPDRYIHTNFDTPANIDPTKLRRAGFIAAASGWFLANAGPRDAGALTALIETASLKRAAVTLARRTGLPGDEAAALSRFDLWRERGIFESLARFGAVEPASQQEAERFLAVRAQIFGPPPPAAAKPSGDGALVFLRNPAVKGPMSVFGYDYLAAHLAAGRAEALRLADGDRYEALNLVDGRRSAQEIRDALAAIYGPLPLVDVVEFLKALAEAGVVRLRGKSG